MISLQVAGNKSTYGYVILVIHSVFILFFIIGIISEKERLLLERVEIEHNKTPRALMVIDWMLLLLKESSINDRFVEKSNFLKSADVVMAFKKNSGNTIKV
jgi:hypothetical protein